MSRITAAAVHLASVPSFPLRLPPPTNVARIKPARKALLHPPIPPGRLICVRNNFTPELRASPCRHVTSGDFYGATRLIVMTIVIGTTLDECGTAFRDIANYHSRSADYVCI